MYTVNYHTLRLSLYFRLLMLILCAVVAMQYYKSLDKKSNLKSVESVTDDDNLKWTIRRPRIVAILTVTPSKRYLFSLPFTVAAWQRINVEPVVIFVGDYGTLKHHHQSNVTINLLKDLSVKVYYITNSTTTAPTLSQVSRLFATAMPFSKDYSSDDIFITGDSDMMPFHLKNHIPNVMADQKAYFYNADCTGPTRVPPAHGNYTVPMYPMSTIGATVATWREIMGFSSTNFNGKQIEKYLNIEFGPDFFHPTDVKNSGFRGSSVWYADQSLISYKVAEWFKANPANRAATTLTRGGCAPRMDRARWPKPNEMQSLNLNALYDAHLLGDGYSDDQWELFKPLIELLFNGSKYDSLRDKLYKYRQDYILID